MAVYTTMIDAAAPIKSRVLELLANDKPLQFAVYNDIQKKSVRIFEQGKASNNALIGGGRYSTKPIYINPNFAPRKGNIRISGGGVLQGLLPTIGKPTPSNPAGEQVFTPQTAWRGAPGTKAGDKHRTTYLKGGYKELRNRTGRRIDIINLRFTNDLFMDWANVASVSAIPKPTRVNAHTYQIRLRRAHNVDKVTGLEARYGKIFDSTTSELKEFIQDLTVMVNKFLRGEEIA